jgi:hypothetical protein
MVQNGLERAREFQKDRLIARWTEVLWRQIPARLSPYRHRLLARARGHRALVRRMRERLGSALPGR